MTKPMVRLQGVEPQPQLVLEDARPRSETVRGYMSDDMPSCDFGAYQLGDKDIQPNRVAMLEQTLRNELRPQVHLKKFVLKHYTVHINWARQRRLQYEQTWGPQDLDFNNPDVTGCAADDYRGSYRLDELTQPGAPAIVVMDVEVEGKNYHVRWVQSAPKMMVRRDSPRMAPAVQ